MPSKQNGHDDTKDTTRSTPSDTYNREEIRYDVTFQSWTTHNKNQDVEETEYEAAGIENQDKNRISSQHECSSDEAGECQLSTTKSLYNSEARTKHDKFYFPTSKSWLILH